VSWPVLVPELVPAVLDVPGDKVPVPLTAAMTSAAVALFIQLVFSAGKMRSEGPQDDGAPPHRVGEIADRERCGGFVW